MKYECEILKKKKEKKKRMRETEKYFPTYVDNFTRLHTLFVNVNYSARPN